MLTKPELVTFSEEILNGKLHFLYSAVLRGFFQQYSRKSSFQEWVEQVRCSTPVQNEYDTLT